MDPALLMLRVRPVAADMATTVAGPQGIMESASLHGASAGPSAQTLKRRDEMKAMLVRRLQGEYGNDPVRARSGSLLCSAPRAGAAIRPLAIGRCGQRSSSSRWNDFRR